MLEHGHKSKKGTDIIMTIYEILDDIHSDRVKKVIIDSDTYNEMDDQYAIAYGIGCEKLKVDSLCATLFNNPRCDGFADGMEKSYAEILHLLSVIGRDVPTYKGCAAPLTVNDETIREADMAPAVENIIKTARESDEIVYVIALASITNIAAAIMLAPDIKEKICVIWVGCNCLENGAGGEFNFGQDPKAGQYVLSCGVPLVLLPAIGDVGHGTQVLIGNKCNLDEAFTGDHPIDRFFRDDLPSSCDIEYAEKPNTWWHVFWDIAGPAVLSIPEAFDLEIMDAPRIRGDWTYAIGEPDRPKMIYMHCLNREKVMRDAFEKINSLK